MPFYQQLGEIPRKRHVVFKKKGKLLQEELVGTLGFAGSASLVYHLNPPTIVKEISEGINVAPSVAVAKGLKCLSFRGFNVQPEKDYFTCRKVLFINNDLRIGVAAPTESPDYFYKNADADEILFFHQGSGSVETMYGKLDFGYGDYILMPRGTVYKISFSTPDNRILFIESSSPVSTPKRYRNLNGQHLEHSPFCERDIRTPKDLKTYDEKGDFLIKIKKQDHLYNYVYGTHPFDVVGWDGYHYPWAFSIHDFEPITGRIHMPPPIHQTFEADSFVVCSFVPRLYDYHPDAIPAPYHHSNIDSDEILYYVDGDFMSRNNISKGQFTLHPGGVPHGPHPGAIERSIGKKETKELAVMIDPFRPVMITEEAMKIDVPDYYKSWMM